MRSFIFFLVFMHSLFACVKFDDPTEPPYPEMYYGKAHIIFESGKPCTTAWAQCQVLINQFQQATADTGGWLYFKSDFGRRVNSPDIEFCPLIVYIEHPESFDDSSKVIYQGDLEMYKSGLEPVPLEIIIPDSLAP